MDKTNINALVQSIERSLHLIHKNIFSIKQNQSPPKLAWICLKNHAVLRHCVFVDGCGYTFTLDGQKSWWGSTGSGGRTAKCAANKGETWLWPWQYILPIKFFLSAAAGVMNTVSVFRWLSGTGEEKMNPDKSVVFAYDGVPAHLDLAIPALYVHSLCFPPRHLSCLKVTPKADISSLEI